MNKLCLLSLFSVVSTRFGKSSSSTLRAGLITEFHITLQDCFPSSAELKSLTHPLLGLLWSTAGINILNSNLYSMSITTHSNYYFLSEPHAYIVKHIQHPLLCRNDSSPLSAVLELGVQDVSSSSTSC